MNQNVMTIYPAGTTNFDYQGYGTLYDAYSAEVTEASSTNGNITETMEITYPVNGVLSDKIVEGNLVKAQISKTDGDYQIFEIDETEKSDNTVITAYLNAYPYRVLRMSFTNGGKFANFETLTRLLDYAKSYMPDLPTDFKITTNISNPINLAQTQTDPALTPEPTVFKDFSSLLDAILNKVSGQVKFGPRSIEILAHRGQDKSNIELRDDKNTNGISVKIDTTNIVNKIIPLLPVKDKDGNSTSGTVVGNIVTPKDPFRFINFYSGQVVNVDTQDLADSYFSRTNCNYPVTTATVTTSMIDEDLSDIRLFDVVSVYSSRINYTAKLKVSERVFDVLAGAVESFKLGTSSVNVFSTQTAAMNQVEQAVAIGNQALTSANGKNTNYYGDSKPTDGKEGDIWFHTVDGVSQMDQFTGGVWKTIVSDTFGKEVDKKVAAAQAEASDAKTKAEEASSNAKATADKFDDTNQKADQALDKAISAQADASSAVAKAESTASEFGPVKQNADSALSAALNAQKDASSAVAKAESTASEFGKVSQKADSAVANALSAQASASSAVSQASSAAADSKDAKQIAGAVSQSYKTLTDGSNMTIAELQNGLAAKLTKTDLNGYATQDWSQNQIKLTADGINSTMSSIKNTVDSQATSINDLKADSSSFKSQFTTVNNTLGTHTTDINSLQASSKELTSGFNTLTSDNTTNKNDISQLKLTSTELSSTMMTVQTQVQDSAVGTNLLRGTRDFSGNVNFWGDKVEVTNSQGQFQAATGTSPNDSEINYDIVSFYSLPLEKDTDYTTSFWAKTSENTNIISYLFDSGSNGNYYDGATINQSTTDYMRFVVHFHNGNNKATLNFIPVRIQKPGVTVWLYGLKLEKGSLATDWCPNPADNATVTALSSLSQTVDGMKADISKKIEQSDLNGYATQTWTQNQIKTTADGINGTISSVKSTVDSQTTSINDLKADSSSFKSQFTTVNNTLGKQTTDISTLQATSKDLTTGFNTLTTDNATNKNDISQLKQTSTEFSSTLETVKTQVQDSSVGTNLLFNAGDDNDLDHPVKMLADHIEVAGLVSRTKEYTQVTADVNSAEMFYRFSDTSISGMHGLEPGKTYTIQGEVSLSKGDLHFRSQRTTPQGGWGNYDTGVSETLVSNSDGFVHVSYTFTVPDNTSDIYTSWQVYGYDSTTILRFRRMKLEKGSVATDFSVNPLDTATVSGLSSLSQTVDGMQLDISKKIEQKDLNGYATQTWTQNQIKLTSDSLSATLSSVKNTVDSQATSINDLQADSRGFKAQFTTVNNTLGTHTTDIGTLQASTKSLSSNFDSLNTANGTNQHNISDLQQTATSFSSTLLTVQQQIKNSAVGTNLLTNTGDLSANWLLNGTVDNSKKPAVLYYPKTTLTSSGSSLIANQQLNDGLLQPSTTYTASFYAKGTGTFRFYCFPDVGIAVNDNLTYIKLSSNFQLYTITFTTVSYLSGEKAFLLRQDYTPSDTDQNTVEAYIYGFKLEKGSLATDWCPNPMDNATVTAVSSISQTIDKIQGTIINKADQSQITQLADQITTTVGQISGVNLIPNSDFSQGKQYWNLSDNASIADHGWKYTDGALVLDPSDTIKDTTLDIIVSPNTDYTFSCNMYGSLHVFLVTMKDTTGGWAPVDDDYQDNSHILTGADGSTPRQSFTLKRTSGQTRRLRLILRAEAGMTRSVFTKFQLEEGKVAHAWGPSTIGLATFSQITQLKDDISLRVEKAGVINAVNVSSEGIQIYGNKLHITADTYIDNAIIKDAMIGNVSADKMTTGTLNAANVNVINLNGSSIVSNSITSNQLASGSVTANKIQSGAIRVSLNNSLQRLEIGVDGMNLMSDAGAIIGRIHSNHMSYDSTFWGLAFDMSANGGDYMTWGAQNNGDVNGSYQTKLAWYRWSTNGYDGGFHFQDRVEFHNPVEFRNSIDTRANYLLEFGSTNVSGYSSVPFLGLSGGATKISFSPGSVWLSRHNNYYNMGAVIEGFSHYLGRAIFIPTGMNSDGRASSWLGINIPSS